MNNYTVYMYHKSQLNALGVLFTFIISQTIYNISQTIYNISQTIYNISQTIYNIS